MKSIVKNSLAIALTMIGTTLGIGVIPRPAQALTPEEARGISIGVTALTCAIANGCYRPVNRVIEVNRPYYYREPVRRVYVVPVQPRYEYRHRRDDNRFYSDRYYNDRSYGYRQNTSYQGVQIVTGDINSIYIEVLGRNADVDGLRTYQSRFNDGWSLEDIRRDLARSDEARNYRNGYRNSYEFRR